MDFFLSGDVTISCQFYMALKYRMPYPSRKARRVRNHKKTCTKVNGRIFYEENPQKADALNNPGFTKNLRRRRSGGTIENIIKGEEQQTASQKFVKIKKYVEEKEKEKGKGKGKGKLLRLRFQYFSEKKNCDFSAIVELRENSLILSDLRDHLINIQDSSCNYIYSTKNYTSWTNPYQNFNDFQFLQENLKYSETGQIRINDPNNNFTYSSRNFLENLKIVSEDSCHEEQKCQSILENLKNSNPEIAKVLFSKYNEQLLNETYNSGNCITDKEKIIKSSGKIVNIEEINIMKHCGYHDIAKKMIIKKILDKYKQDLTLNTISQDDYDTVVKNLGYTDFIDKINYARQSGDKNPTPLEQIILPPRVV